MSARDTTLKSEPLVTIVTATYNLIDSKREKYFRQNLESVHGQTYGNIEHLIVDGASKDGTVEIIKEYADKGWIRYISEPDKGIYEAMNKGIALAHGKYLVTLNSDDFYHNKGAVELSVKALEESGADFSYANFIVVGENQRYIERGQLERFLYIMPFGHPTMFVKTSVLRDEGGFDETLGLPADYDLIIRLILKNYKAVYIDSELVTYRLGGVGTIIDHSNEIGKIYLKNFSAFYHFSGITEAKKIMYEGIVPATFPDKFYNYAKRNRLDNMDISLVVSNLRAMAPKKKTAVYLEKIKSRLRKYPVLLKLWKLLRKR